MMSGSPAVAELATWWLRNVAGARVRPSSLGKYEDRVERIVAEAVALELIATNPVDRVRPPTVRAASRRALTAAEGRALVAAAADDRLGAAVALLIVQGWRVSEVLGLAWGDVDLDEAAATVRCASVYADGIGMMIGPPKTGRGSCGVKGRGSRRRPCGRCRVDGCRRRRLPLARAPGGRRGHRRSTCRWQCRGRVTSGRRLR